MMNRIRIAPSILAADLSCLTDEIARATEGGCDVFHIDIMDGHFVPNLSFGPNIVETVRRLTPLPLDVHLMVDNPETMIGPFAAAGSTYLTVHAEISDDIPTLLDLIEAAGAAPGLSLKPDTPVASVLKHLHRLALVLVMSVYPGFGGQAFIEESYDRIRAIADRCRELADPPVVSVDGGVTPANAGQLVLAGATQLVAGTAVFRDHAAVRNIADFRAAIAAVSSR